MGAISFSKRSQGIDINISSVCFLSQGKMYPLNFCLFRELFDGMNQDDFINRKDRPSLNVQLIGGFNRFCHSNFNLLNPWICFNKIDI